MNVARNIPIYDSIQTTHEIPEKEKASEGLGFAILEYQLPIWPQLEVLGSLFFVCLSTELRRVLGSPGSPWRRQKVSSLWPSMLQCSYLGGLFLSFLRLPGFPTSPSCSASSRLSPVSTSDVSSFPKWVSPTSCVWSALASTSVEPPGVNVVVNCSVVV